MRLPKNVVKMFKNEYIGKQAAQQEIITGSHCASFNSDATVNKLE